MGTKLRRRIRVTWQTARFFTRMLLEHIGTVWLLGSAPLLAHLAAAAPQRGYDWIPNDLYLFVMVTGGTIAIEAFKDRSSDGPSRPLAAIFGTTLALAGAYGFAVLETGVAPIDAVLRPLALRLVLFSLSIDFVCRAPVIMRNAITEANAKGVAL